MSDMIPNSALKKFLNKEIDIDTDTIKVMLLTNSHSNDPDTQEFIDDVSANQVSGTGYTAGGATLASKTLTQDNTNNKAVFDAGDITWSSANGFTARYAVIYKDTGTAGTSPIIAIFDFGADKTASGSDFILTWNASGILSLAQA